MTMPPHYSMKTKPRFLGLLLAAATFASVGHAMAQGTKQDADWAHSQFNKAMRDNDNKDYETARKILIEVWSRSKTYDVASELARSEYQLGHIASSAKYTAFALANAAPRESRSFTEANISRSDWAKQQVYTATVKVTPSRTDVIVDGVAYDVPIELGLFLDPGTHQVEFRCEGYASEKRTINAKANIQEELLVNLARGSAAEPATNSTTVVTPRPTAAPPFNEPPSMATTNEPNPWILVGGGVVTVGSLVTGLVFNTKSGNAKNDVDSLRAQIQETGVCDGTNSALSGDCRSLHDKAKDADRFRSYSTIGFGVAGVAAVGTVVYWLWPRETHQQQRGKIKLDATMAKNTGALWVTGSF